MKRTQSIKSVKDELCGCSIPCHKTTNRAKSTIQRLLGKLIRDARKEKGLSLRKLSDEASVSLTLLTDIENGKKIPNIETILKLAYTLEIPLTDIFNQNILPAKCKEESGECVNDMKQESTYDECLFLIEKFLAEAKFRDADILEIHNFIDYMKFRQTANTNTVRTRKRLFQ